MQSSNGMITKGNMNVNEQPVDGLVYNIAVFGLDTTVNLKKT